jgi:hypothetical protein
MSPLLIEHGPGKLLSGDPFIEIGPLVIFSTGCGAVLSEQILLSSSTTRLLVQPSHISEDESVAMMRTSLVEVHDLIHPEAGLPWSPAPFDDWFETISQSQSPEPLQRQYHWVSWRDVVEALVTLTMAKNPLPERLTICSRRSSSAEHTLKRFTQLMNRCLRVLSNSIGHEDLLFEEEVVSEVGDPRIGRPDLAPLHDALIESGHSDGWRPRYDLDITIMEWLSNKLEKQKGVV